MQRKQTQEKKDALRNHISYKDNMMNNIIACYCLCHKHNTLWYWHPCWMA